MEEKELIQKIKLLRQIKPRKEWVFLTKSQILGEELTVDVRRRHLPPFSLIWEILPRLFLNYKLNYRLALATFLFFGILISGAFSFAQNSLPGDFLYSLKRISEKGQAIFVSEEEKPQAQLELANKRLDELTKIAQTNQTQKLAPAINEFQASVAQVAKDLKKPRKLTKEVVGQTKKLEENKKKVEALGVVVGESEDLDNALAQLVEREIEDLENRTLSEGQEELLNEAKEDFEAGDLTQALENILKISGQ